MAEEPECQLRRRRSSANPNLPINLAVGFQIDEGGPKQGTPSPSGSKHIAYSKRSSLALLELKNKQQSLDIQVEDCEEIEIILDSDDEGTEDNEAVGVDRAITPTPIQDFAANVTYTEGPQATDFLKVNTLEQDCYTDVSDADSEEEDE